MAGDGDFQFGMISDQVIALVHSANNPSEAAWSAHYDAMYGAVGEGRFIELGYFVITAGGAPNAKQRREGNQHVKGRKMIRAIVTDSFLVRQLIKSWSWFAPGLSVYAPDQLRAGLLSVGVPESQLEQAWQKVVALNAALSTPVAWVPKTLAEPPGATAHARAP
jgi:hypothetical protein